MNPIIRELRNEMFIQPPLEVYHKPLPAGTKVLVRTCSDIPSKEDADGHICIINTSEISLVPQSGYWKYELKWKQEDNPGRWKPDALNDYYYMENEVTAIAGVYPSAITAQINSLPDI